MTNVLTWEQAVSVLRDIIKERGVDYVYQTPFNVSGFETCVYKDGNEPSCIIGHLVAREFPDVYDTIGVGIGNSMSVGSLINQKSVARTPPIVADESKLVEALRTLQDLQDDKVPWGNAFEAAFGEPVEG